MTELNPNPFDAWEPAGTQQARPPHLPQDDAREVDVNALRVRVVGDMADLTEVITAAERQLRERGNTPADLEHLIRDVEAKRNCLLISITAWEGETHRNLDGETDYVCTKAINASSRLVGRLTEEIRTITRAPDPKDPGAENDATALHARLMTEAAAVKVERRYSEQYFQQRARSNAARTERLERRIAKRAEAEKLLAEAEMIQEEEARIREDEEKRKSEIELEMKEESIRVQMQVLAEIGVSGGSTTRPAATSHFEDDDLAQVRASSDRFLARADSFLSDSVTELKSRHPAFAQAKCGPAQEPTFGETLKSQADTIQRQRDELLSLRRQVQELMRERSVSSRMGMPERRTIHFEPTGSTPISNNAGSTSLSRGHFTQGLGPETYGRASPHGAPRSRELNELDDITPISQSPALNSSQKPNEGDVLKILSEQLTLSRLPIVEPRVFSGRDPLYFPKWKIEFETLIHHRAIPPSERLHYLSRYLGGEAKDAIEGFLYMRSPDAYQQAYLLLNRRYGDNSELATTFRQRLRAWPKLGPTDTQGLRKFVDFLRQCQAAISSSNLYTLEILNDEAENIEIIKRLPLWLSRAWARKVTAHRSATGSFPPFKDFVAFLSDEDDIANDPVSKAIQGNSLSAPDSRRATGSSSHNPDSRRVGNRAFATETLERAPPPPPPRSAYFVEGRIL